MCWKNFLIHYLSQKYGSIQKWSGQKLTVHVFKRAWPRDQSHQTEFISHRRQWEPTRTCVRCTPSWDHASCKERKRTWRHEDQIFWSDLYFASLMHANIQLRALSGEDFRCCGECCQGILRFKQMSIEGWRNQAFTETCGAWRNYKGRKFGC